MLSGSAVRLCGLVCGFVWCSAAFGQTATLQSVVNAASLGKELSPGSAAIVQGAGFGPESALRLGDTVILPAPGSTLPGRFNVFLPATLVPGTYQATVTTGTSVSPPISITLAGASPAFYSVIRDGATQGAFFDDTFSAITTEKGAVHGTRVTAYANGLGPGDGAPPVFAAKLPLRVSIRGDGGWTSVPATAQQDSSLIGYWQVSFLMPDGFVQGLHDAYLSAGTIDGPVVGLPVGGAILAAVVNAASNAKEGPVAPGSLVAIYGSELTPSDQDGLLPATTLPGGGQIRIGGIAAPLTDVSATFGQAHIVVPWEVAAADAVDVIIENSFGLSRPYRVRVAETAVGIFRLSDPSNAARQNAAALIEGTAWAAIPPSMAAALKLPQNCRAGFDKSTPCAQPASAGDILQVYVTGLGKVVPPLATGRVAPADGSVLHRAAAIPQVTIGGIPADVLFAGIAPGFAGLYQVDVVVPAGVAPGDEIPLVITMPAGDRDSATIAVR